MRMNLKALDRMERMQGMTGRQRWQFPVEAIKHSAGAVVFRLRQVDKNTLDHETAETPDAVFLDEAQCATVGSRTSANYVLMSIGDSSPLLARFSQCTSSKLFSRSQNTLISERDMLTIRHEPLFLKFPAVWNSNVGYESRRTRPLP